MSDALRVTARLDRREVQAASAESGAQMASPPRYYLVAIGLILIVCLYVAPFFAFPLVQFFPPESWVLVAPLLAMVVPLIGFLIGFTWVHNWHNRRAWAAYERAWAERDVPTELEATYTIEDGGLRMENTRGDYLLYWQSITDLFRVTDGWAVNSDISSYFIPSLAFETLAQEQAFIAAMIERMTPAAVGRSKAACDLAGKSARPD